MRVKTGLVMSCVAIVACAVAAIVVAARIANRGLSARDEPSAVEEIAARTMRRLAVPRRAKSLANPVYPSDEALSDARAHFADHCAICHANDGSGDTTIGRNLYPKAPDMRLDATQSLTDGELYAIIQDGLRLTGMPAWGKAGDENDEDSWRLVHLIRHLNDLTPEQLKEMEGMNPRNPAEIEEERLEQEFLSGGAEPPDDSRKKSSAHKHR